MDFGPMFVNNMETGQHARVISALESDSDTLDVIVTETGLPATWNWIDVLEVAN